MSKLTAILLFQTVSLIFGQDRTDLFECEGRLEFTPTAEHEIK